MHLSIYFGAGCFWCTEAAYQDIPGVVSVTSGYSGGTEKNPTYESVSRGSTGHAEVVQVIYEDAKINIKKLLEIFFTIHDPTSLHKQGADVGTHYRSVIYYTNTDQKKAIDEYIEQLRTLHIYNKPIVTEVTQFVAFYEAEEYHQNFYKKNPFYGYCKAVIEPKLKKLRDKSLAG